MKKILKYEDFEPLKLLRTVCFGRVLLVRKKITKFVFNENIIKMRFKTKASRRTYKNRKRSYDINKQSINYEYKMCFSR